jgi:hypothetical protein
MVTFFFSKFKNKKFQFKLQNEKFSNFFLSNFPCGINDFFSEVAKFIKRLQKLPIYPYQKIVIYCIPPLSGMVHGKRANDL